MNCLKVLLAIGALLGALVVIAVQVICYSVVQDIIDEQIADNVILKKNTAQFDRFKKLDFDSDFKVYFFNYLNSDEIMKGALPEVEEVGPFIYSKSAEKNSIEFDNEGHIVFNQGYGHKFNAEKSAYPEDHEIVMPIVPLLLIAQNVEGTLLDSGVFNSVYKAVFNIDKDKETIFHKTKVEDYAFGGTPFCVNPQTFFPKKFCKQIREEVKENPSMEVLEDRITFSFLKKNNNDDGPYLIETGENDINKLGNILEYKGSNKTETWIEDSECNDIEGTDSRIYKPYNTKGTVLKIFSSDICRRINLNFETEMSYKDIPGYRYTFSKRNMDWSFEENNCFHINETKNLDGELLPLPSGFMDLQKCVGGPLVLSLPHFLWGDEEYASTVIGLKAEEKKHKTFVEMEPNTGSPMVGHKRVQFNLLLRPYSRIKVTKNVNSTVLPLMWIDETTEIPDNLAQIIKDQYVSPVGIVTIVKWVVTALGLVLFLACSSFLIYKFSQSDNKISSTD